MHVGGGSAAALRRVVEFGNGWHALGKSPSEIAEDCAQLGDMMRAAGRHDEVHVSLRCGLQVLDEPGDRPVEKRRTLRGTPAEITATARAYADAGVDELVIDPGTRDLDANRAALQLALDLLI